MDPLFDETRERTGRMAAGGTLDSPRATHAALERATIVFYRASLRPEVRLETISGNVRDLTGYGPDELVADVQLIRNLVHSDDRARFDGFLADPGQAIGSCTLRLIHRDGRVLRAEHVAFVVRDDDGAATALEGLVRDVTPIGRPGDAERAGECDALPVVAYLSDAGGFTTVNPAILTLTGFTAEEWVAHPTLWAERLHPDDRARVLALSTAGATGHAWQAEYRWLARDGRIIWIDQSSAPIRDAHGALVCLHGLMLDGTARKTSPADPPDTQRMHAIGRLAGVVAHDFNNMLAVIMGHAEMLLDTFQEPGSSRRSALEIRNAAEHAARVTSQLLAVSGRQALSISLVDVNDVARDCADTLHELAGSDLDLRFDLARKCPLVETDVRQLERVLRNLVVDAREATPAGGRLTIATRAAGGEERREVVLTVSDNRPVVSGDATTYAFEPTLAHRRSVRGSGLNRAAIYGIVTQLGGHISAAAVPGGGVTFTISLPAKDR